jgi:hypothetical protein
MSNSHDINNPGIDIWTGGFRLRRGEDSVTTEQVQAMYENLTISGLIEHIHGEWHLASSLCTAFEFCVDTRNKGLERMIVTIASHTWLVDRCQPELAGTFYGLSVSTLPTVRLVLAGQAGGAPIDSELKQEFMQILNLADKELPLVPVPVRRIHLMTIKPHSK